MDISPQKVFGGYKAHEKMLTLLIIKEIKSKTTRVSHLTQPRVAYVLRYTYKMAERTWRHGKSRTLMLAM